MVAVRPQQKMPLECQCILLDLTRLPLSSVSCQGNQKAAEMFDPVMVVIYICLEKKIQYIYMCATNYKTRWFLTLVTAWKHCILSLSPSIERTPSRKHTVCAVTFLKTHCPWANDGRENCCLNIYSTPEMSSSHTQKIPLPDSVFTTNVATKVLQLLCSIFVSATNLLTL